MVCWAEVLWLQSLSWAVQLQKAVLQHQTKTFAHANKVFTQ
jgi:hypothetical protein